MARTESGRGKARRDVAETPPLATAVGAPKAPVVTPEWRAARRFAINIFLAYLAMLGVSCLIMHSSAVVARGNETTFDRSVFTAVNACTLTGFQQTMGLREMRAAGMAGPLLMLFLTFCGSLMSLIVGGLAACRVLRMPHTTWQIVWAAISSILLATMGGAAALAGNGRSVFEAIFQSASAFSNSGLWIGEFPSTTAGSTYFVLLPLVVLGGLGLPVLIELSDRIFGGPPISRHSRLVLTLTASFYLAGVIALLLAQTSAAIGGGWAAWRATLASCSIAAVSTRSAGLPFQSPASFTVAAQWLLMALMLIGAAPAGTAGGIKTTTVWQLRKGIADVLRGRVPHRATGVAAVWVSIFGLVLFAGVMLLFSSEPQISADRLIFLACSAIGNVGLSHDPVSITGPGLLILSALMLAGRIGSLAILWWLAETTGGIDVLVG
jgi:Trk-type K+ transport system membrane component